MGILYSQVYSDTTSIPSNSGALTFNNAFNLPGGMVEEVILRVTTANTTNAVLADFGNILTACRIILNGNTVTDFRSGYSSSTNNAASQANAFLNSLGEGRMVEVPGDTAKEAYFRWPVGRQMPAGISRIETEVTWAATNAAVASGTCQWWIRYNNAAPVTSTIVASTSFNHAASEETVVVRVPSGVPGTLAGVFVQNDTAADQLNGIRTISQSDYSLSPGQIRAFNGDLSNGIMYADDDVSTTAQQVAVSCDGGMMLPLFGLTTNDDLRLIVNSSAVTTRTYTPVLTRPISGKAEPQGTQTEALIASPATAILDRAED